MVYVCDRDNNKIRRINSTGFTTTFAGNGSKGIMNGPGLSSTFDYPFSIVFDSLTGNLTLASISEATIRRITPDGTVSLFVSSNQLSGIVVDSSSNLYVSNVNTNRGALMLLRFGRQNHLLLNSLQFKK